MGLLACVLLALFGLLGLRLVQIQLWQGPRWVSAAERQRYATERRPAPRGDILAADGTPLARSLPHKTVIADLQILRDPGAAALALAPWLGKDPQSLAARMMRADRRVVYLARDIEPELAERIAALKLRGIGLEDSFRRGYLWGALGCHVIGCAGPDGGLEGLELFMEPLLRGIPGYRTYERDGTRRALSRGDERCFTPQERAARPGLAVTLTLEPAIQYAAEEELGRLMQQYRPVSAATTVMDARTGAILAMACSPRFDPNEPGASEAACRRNRAVTDCYEPGSTFKTFIAAMALDRGACSRADRFDCENGAWRLGYRTLHDAHAYGVLTFDEVIIKSSNIGAAKIGMRLGLDGVYSAVRAFGFGAPTRLDLPGERAGMVRLRPRWTRDSLLSVPMGQEISVTPIQLLAGYTAMVNGGILFRPQLVARITSPNGEQLFSLRAQPVRRVISPAASRAMREILRGVVDCGTGRTAWSKEYAIAGKTGTAQKVVNGCYSHEKYVGSFCGFAPASQPRLVCLVTVDEPQKGLGYYGGTVAAPAVREILRRGLNALGIPPRTPAEQALALAAYQQRRFVGGD
jgi:cell division protein FtsI (penicillin-binding protein 3)